jgi:hypothetical protein
MYAYEHIEIIVTVVWIMYTHFEINFNFAKLKSNLILENSSRVWYFHTRYLNVVNWFVFYF